jgi:hypothetical protein
MNEAEDRWERGIEALKAQARGRARYDVALEKRIMHEFSNVQARRRRRFAALAAVAVVVAVSGLGIAAAGGVDAVRGWFGIVEVWPDGQSQRLNVQIQGTELVDESGNAVGQLLPVAGSDDFELRLNGSPTGAEQSP